MSLVCTENRSFPSSTLQTQPEQVEEEDPTHWCQKDGNLPTLPEKGTPSSRCRGTAGFHTQHWKQPSKRRSPPMLPVKKIPTHPAASPPLIPRPRLPTAQGEAQKEAITGDLAAQSRGCVTPTYRS